MLGKKIETLKEIESDGNDIEGKERTKWIF